MLENRSFDHLLGYLYSDSGNVSPAGQPFEGLTGSESNPARRTGIPAASRLGVYSAPALAAAAPATAAALSSEVRASA